MQYPLGEHEKERITSKTGKKLTDITLDEVMKGPRVHRMTSRFPKRC